MFLRTSTIAACWMLDAEARSGAVWNGKARTDEKTCRVWMELPKQDAAPPWMTLRNSAFDQ